MAKTRGKGHSASPLVREHGKLRKAEGPQINQGGHDDNYGDTINREMNGPPATTNEGISVVLALPGNRPEFAMTSFEKIALVEKGLSKKALNNFKQAANIGYDQLAQLLNVARSSLISKKSTERFNKDLSDKILGLASIYSYGFEVFEDRDRFNGWLATPNKALGGQTPFDLLHNSFGREEVKNLIGRIDYGIYS